MENMIITIVAALSAVLVSVLFGLLSIDFMKTNFLNDYELNISREIVIKPIVFGVIQCFFVYDYTKYTFFTYESYQCIKAGII